MQGGQMLDLTPWQIAVFAWGLCLTGAQAISIIGNAVEKLTKLRRAAAAPNAEQNKRLDELERRMDEAEAKLGRDFAAFRSLEESTSVTQRALLALLGHGLHGNNVEEMAGAERELKEYLTKHH